MRSTIYLADTNILSELFRPQPDTGVVAWAEAVPLICVSVISVEELFYGLAWKPRPRTRAQLEIFLDTYCELLPITAAIAGQAGQLRGELQGRGISGSQADMLIAATAKVHQLPLATRNVRHFEDCGIRVLNPFRD